MAQDEQSAQQREAHEGEVQADDGVREQPVKHNSWRIPRPPLDTTRPLAHTAERRLPAKTPEGRSFVAGTRCEINRVRKEHVMQNPRPRALGQAPWKTVLDRLAVAWIVCAPLLALAAAWSSDDRMAPPATHGVVLTSHGKEERVESSALGPRRGSRGDCDRQRCAVDARGS